jgi:ATP-dependent DNA helicase RecQ
MAGTLAEVEPPEAVLRRHFGYSGFRPGQRELVAAALQGRDAIGILPTGGGKSVCYQVPSLMLEGLTVVVSPLVSLMADQVRRAREAGLPAECLHSGRSAAEIAGAERDLKAGMLKLLLVAPERFSSPRFQRLLPYLRVSLLTIDEAPELCTWRKSPRTFREVR